MGHSLVENDPQRFRHLTHAKKVSHTDVHRKIDPTRNKNPGEIHFLEEIFPNHKIKRIENVLLAYKEKVIQTQCTSKKQ